MSNSPENGAGAGGEPTSQGNEPWPGQPCSSGEGRSRDKRANSQPTCTRVNHTGLLMQLSQRQTAAMSDVKLSKNKILEDSEYM